MAFLRTFWTSLAVSAGIVTSGHAAELVTIKQLNTKTDGTDTLVGISVTSIADTPLKQVFVRCAALDGSGSLIATGLAQFQNLKPGETAYDFAPLRKLGTGKFDVSCRADSIQP